MRCGEPLKAHSLFELYDHYNKLNRISETYKRKQREHIPIRETIKEILYTDFPNFKNRFEALDIVVSLSSPSKMPCFGYSLPAKFCKTGSKLAKMDNTICSGCYALKGWYSKSHVYKIQVKRLLSLQKPRWVEAMIYLIRHKQAKHFRWHDSGDIQDLQHFFKLADVANGTSKTLHWLPTREYDLAREFWIANGRVPLYQKFPNLIIRLSATHFDEQPPFALAKEIGVGVSMVSSGRYSCPAHDQGDKCLDCRNCWNYDIPLITYRRH